MEHNLDVAQRFVIHESMVVKPGVLEQNLHLDIGGWQGEVVEVMEKDDKQFITIAWDAITLQRMVSQFPLACTPEGMGELKLMLRADDIAPVAAHSSAPAGEPTLSYIRLPITNMTRCCGTCPPSNKTANTLQRTAVLPTRSPQPPKTHPV